MRLSQKVILLFTGPLPSPRCSGAGSPLKQIRGGCISFTLKLLHPFPYWLREGDGGRVQKIKREMNSTFDRAFYRN